MLSSVLIFTSYIADEIKSAIEFQVLFVNDVRASS
jgi:hypothetical protein